MSERVRGALVGSDSQVAKDPRVLRQIQWLLSDGWTVDTLGRGPAPACTSGRHFEMRRPHRILQILANVAAPHSLRNRLIVEWTIPRELRRNGSSGYDAVVLNEVELLPWYVRRGRRRLAEHDATSHHLDLHEFVPGQGHGLQFRLIYRRYRLWLSSFVNSDVFTSRSTVSPGIGRLYSRFFGVPHTAVVLSCPEFRDLIPSPVAADRIALIHHGSAASVRGLHLMIEAISLLPPRFTLTLMLVGSAERVEALRALASALGDQIRFIEPVDITEVPERLNEFDIEVIFFPPITANLRHTLPNKLFEAVQGRLGVVIGRSPDMTELLAPTGIATVANGWSARDLADTIGALTRDDVVRMKARSHEAAGRFSAQTEGRKFLAVIGGSDRTGDRG